MEIPNGYSKEEVIKIITDILNDIADKYTFGIYEKEDIKQEGFIIAINKVLPNYNGSTKLKYFMTVGLHRRLKIFKRDNYIRPDRPCSKCKIFDKDCEKCKKRKENQTSKLNLLNPIDIHSIVEEKKTSYEGSLLDSLEMIELVDKVNKRLPVEFREDYLRIKEGLYVSKRRREQIERLITEIVETHD